MRDESLQRLSDHVDVDRSQGHPQSDKGKTLSKGIKKAKRKNEPREVKVSKMSVVESGIVRPGRDVPGELSLVSRGEEMLEVADMKLDHSETKTFKYQYFSMVNYHILFYLFCLYSS